MNKVEIIRKLPIIGKEESKLSLIIKAFFVGFLFGVAFGYLLAW